MNNIVETQYLVKNNISHQNHFQTSSWYFKNNVVVYAQHFVGDGGRLKSV